jgi:hypothetical protein
MELAEKEYTSEEMRSSAAKMILSLISSQRTLWNIRGSQMQTFMRMEALKRKTFIDRAQLIASR